jgi:Fic family protein
VKINVDIKADILTDKGMANDRGEDVSLMEPMLFSADSRFREELTNLAFNLVSRSAGFRHSLPKGTAAALADLVRSMNCYYSNLIEGHNTHPVDIERALKNNYSRDANKRNLQYEAKAHIEVQRWIDGGGLAGRATTREGIKEIHRRFCENLPKELLWVENPDTQGRLAVIPGQLRRNDVKVGEYVPVSPGALPRFLDRFEAAYTPLGKAELTVATAAAHHRLAWVHPFLDGNGRVVRLMSHATLLETLDTGALWSVARGLARNVEAYKAHLANCDQKRRNDFDGRGNLSEEALAEFTRFFLTTCIDQVDFMENLVQPDRLRIRVLLWAEEEIRMKSLPPKSVLILETLLNRGELPRGEVARVLGVTDRHSRRIVAELIRRSVIVSENPYGPLHLAFPAALASRWMPGLFPDK